MELKVASRKKVKIKMLISSPAGFGKTKSALRLAYGMTGDWGKIAVIDTENESASLFSNMGPFQTIAMKPPFTVADFQKAVKMCIDAGIELIIADSVTHYWDEVKNYVDSLGSGFTNWKKGTPMWQRLLDTILQTDCHFICTGRKKQAYEMGKDDKGKSTVEKKGLENQLRDGFDYEMTIAFEIINDLHLAKAAKDRTEMFSENPEFVITEKTGEKILVWCNLGVDLPKQLPMLTEEQFNKAAERVKKGEDLLEKMKTAFTLTEDQIAVLTRK